MRRSTGARQRGYALIMVMAALALLTLVIGRFALRVDAQRATALQQQEAQAAEWQAHQVWAYSMYWLAVHRPGPAGYGAERVASPSQLWMVDDRLYRLDGVDPALNGAGVRLQDLRGLLPLNAPVRAPLVVLLQQHGMSANRADAMVDVLEDYIDTDNLKRLNGAEKPEYEALGLPPPRNDYLVSVSELQAMPLWRDDPALLAKIQPYLSTLRDGRYNPAAAPLPVVKALAPGGADQQYRLFEALREERGFFTGEQAQASTGLSLRLDDVYYYHASEELRLSVWTQGLPRGVQYTFLLTPGSAEAPWVVVDVRPETRPPPDQQTTARALALPLPTRAATPASAPAF